MSISDPLTVHLSDTDVESVQDSTILVRERTRGTKLEGAYKKRKGALLEQSHHTITFLHPGRNQTTVLSKRESATVPINPVANGRLQKLP